MTQPISVDIWSDVACPWCYIGKRRFETALAEFRSHENSPEVVVTYHSFQLAPDLPVDFEGDQLSWLVDRKGLNVEQVKGMMQHVTDLAATVGLTYDMDAVQMTNTSKAHELLHFAKAQGKQIEMKERVMSAYFEQGKHVGQIDVLVELAAEIGLDKNEVRTALESSQYANNVRSDIAQAHAYGISGVPFYAINEQYGISGAQEPAAYLDVLATVVNELED